MAFTPTQEAQVLQLIAEQAALLSLADNEATIISKLGATKVNLSSLGSAVAFNDADIMLIRQGTTDLSIAGSIVKAAVAVPDATDTVKGKSSLAVAANYPSASDAESATPAYVSSAVAAAPSVSGLFSNLKVSATGLSALATITADELVVRSGTNYKTLTSVSVTPSLAASGANGLDTGTSAANTWYSEFVIWNPTTLAVAGLFSLSSTTPTMPAGYTHKARVGWVRSDSTANKFPLCMSCHGNKSYYIPTPATNLLAFPVMATGVATNTPAAWSNFAPPTSSRLVVVAQSATGGNIGISASASSGQIVYNTQISGALNNISATLELFNTNIYWTSSGAGSLQCYGWEDNL